MTIEKKRARWIFICVLLVEIYNPRTYHNYHKAMEQSKAYDYLFKLLLIGDVGVGKTSINTRYCDSVFTTTLLAILGVDFKHQSIILDGKKVRLQIWDDIGDKRNQTTRYLFDQERIGIMLVYDVTNEKSFDNITNWIRNLEDHAGTGLERILIGNKCDMQERKIEREKGENLAREHGFLFFETSAKENINVEEAFLSLARAIKAKLDAKPTLPPPVNQPLLKLSRKYKVHSSSRFCCSII